MTLTLPLLQVGLDKSIDIYSGNIAVAVAICVLLLLFMWRRCAILCGGDTGQNGIIMGHFTVCQAYYYSALHGADTHILFIPT